jgi:hypothetical protein
MTIGVGLTYTGIMRILFMALGVSNGKYVNLPFMITMGI